MNEVRRALAVRFAENLVRARKGAGLSQEEVGFRALLHRTQVGVLERGERLPRLDTIVKLAGGLSVSPCDLMRGMAWEQAELSGGGFRLTDSDEATEEDHREPARDD